MSLEDYSRHTCDDHSHSHLSKSQVEELQRHGALEWLRGSLGSQSKKERSKEKPVVKIRRFFAARGLSCSVGAEIAEMLRDDGRRLIGSAMLAHIKMRSEEQRVAA
jgi:SOS response regulatory protein OraA/RecX